MKTSCMKISPLKINFRILFTGFFLLSGSSGLVAQSVDQQHQHGDEPSTTDALVESDHTQHAMDNEDMTLRDPHAYSNGFGLTSGPYALADQRQVKLADEAFFTGLWVDRLEAVERDSVDSTVLEGYGWWGNSYKRLLFKVETELVNDSVEEAELDLLWSRAISPFWNFQFGPRREIGGEANRNWLAVGFNGLAPYWFEIDVNAYLGESGRLAFNFETEYQLLLTQRLVLQPSLDISAFGDTDRQMGHGKGLAELTTGMRLRYEINRQLAPYLGIEWSSKFGETADLLPAGVDRRETRWVLGLRFWF